MGNHLDLALQDADFHLPADHSLAFVRGRHASSGNAMPLVPEATSVKSAIAHYPAETGADITGRWRPRWPEGDVAGTS